MTQAERMEKLGLLTMLIGPQTPHAHRCGFDLDDPNAAGCGQEWSHDPRQIRSGGEHERAHHCPRCGRGPWTWQVTQSTQEEFSRRYNRAA